MNEVTQAGLFGNIDILATLFWIVGTIFVAFLVYLPIKLAKAYRRVVEPNEIHVVRSRKGTVIYGQQDAEDAKASVNSDENMIPEASSNSYYEWPSWWPVIGVSTVKLPLAVFPEALNDYDAYDIGKVPFVVDIVAFFRISDPQTAAKRVSSMNELQSQLKSILQGAVRTILAKHEIEEIMTERSTFGLKFTEEVRDQLKAWGISNVKNIELMDIRDGEESRTVSNIMAKKESLIEKESRTEVAANKKDAKIAEIDAERATDVRKQEALQLVGERTAEKDKIVGIANQKAQQEIQTEGKITAERDMAVAEVEQVRTAEIAKMVRVVKADEQRQVDITETEGKKQQTILLAEGQLKDQQLKGEGILAVGTASAEAKRLAEMALVSPQIALATEIGENENYQTYLIRIREVEKDQAVGVQQAMALQDAGIKVIANTGNVSQGVSNVMELFSPKGGTAISGAVEAFAQTPQGEAILKALGMAQPPAEPKVTPLRAEAGEPATKKVSNKPKQTK
jgi:flotillin